MSKIYKYQTSLRFQANCQADINGALETRIKYETDDGATGSWAAQVLNATSGQIYYDVTTTGDVNKDGTWTLWGWVKFSDSRVAPGEPDRVRIFEEGS